jgi:branched-chain amino acid transport system ATP-binding protein
VSPVPLQAAPILETRDLTRHFGGIPALDGVSLRVETGSITSLIGPNGAGKTTFINCVTGAVAPERGTVSFRGEDVTRLPVRRRAGLGLTRTFQNLRLFPRMSVLDNVLCGLTPVAGDSFLEALFRLPSLRDRERGLTLRARHALDLFGLGSRSSLPAGVLSYGDKKRIELARACVSAPALVLLDEPVAGLNQEETAQVGQLIRRMRGEGMTVLLVEHDMELIMSVSDRVLVLDGGRFIAQGTPDEVVRNPLVLEAYLGRLSATA